MKPTTIESCLWTEHEDGSVDVVAFLRIDTDGVGNHHGDRTAQNETTYKPNLNADVDKFMVVPGKIRKGVKGVVIGCQGHVMDTKTGRSTDVVVGDVGPNDRSGEVSRAVALALGIEADPNKGGWDESRRFRYWFKPGQPAVVDGKKYKLQAA